MSDTRNARPAALSTRSRATSDASCDTSADAPTDAPTGNGTPGGHHAPFSTPRLEIAQMHAPPPGFTPGRFRAWGDEFARFVEELRGSAERRLTDDHRQYLMRELGFSFADFDDPLVAFGALGYLREFAALHVGDREGVTAAQRALARVGQLPERVRGYIERLIRSHWDLYEVQALTVEGFALRRLHDDARFVLNAPERNQPFLIGHVVALRLVDLGPLVASTLAIQLDEARVGELVLALEGEFLRGRYRPEQWEEFMHARGSFVILRHAIGDFHTYDRLDDGYDDTFGPADAALECVDVFAVLRLHDAFVALDDVVVTHDARHAAGRPLFRTARPGSDAPQAGMALPEMASPEMASPGAPRAFVVHRSGGPGPVFRAEFGRTLESLLVFEDLASHAAYERYVRGDVTTATLDAVRFVRAQRVPVTELSPAAAERLARAGLDPHYDGVVLPVRFGPGYVDEDLTPEDVEQLVDACYYVAALLESRRAA